MAKKLKKIIIVLIIIAMCLVIFLFNHNGKSELKQIKSDKQLVEIYKGKTKDSNIFFEIATLPFTIESIFNYGIMPLSTNLSSNDSNKSDASNGYSTQASQESSSTTKKDYSTTNIQVENVDEADITKTDGDYIYSISNHNVIITNVMNPEHIEIEANIKGDSDKFPEDLLIYNNILVVISTTSSASSRYTYSYEANTIVEVYDITTKKKPTLLKQYELREPYYTSRCIDNMLYVISSGNLREEEKDKVQRKYSEENVEKEIELKNIHYLKDVETTKQTLISTVDLDNPKKDVNVNSYLLDISNAYVSKDGIYLLNKEYNHNNYEPPISSIFGFKGIIGAFTYNEDSEDEDYRYKTEIYKFDIEKDGDVVYSAKNKIVGRTINQYSLDEKDGHLRVATYDTEGTKITIFDQNLNKIGETDSVAKGETMYSSRFIGDKVYLVTYKTVDPLFVIDLSNETKPKVLGKLKIPGYSTYLHPYDENHIIGIGMQTEEFVNRNSSGRVISNTSIITGMKMALFDVSNVSNPVQISETVIGDRKTTSAILTNPKALLFSKEKELIAIPVNNYSKDFETEISNDSYSSIIEKYKNGSKDYISEGYLVYKINLAEGFKQKGVITHENSSSKRQNASYYYYNNTSKLLRGLYIENNLYTISETAIKVNNLDTLNLVSELKIK